jgi:hypothetical protein
MKAPLLAILVVILFAVGSYWIITSIRKDNERKAVALSVRKLALSIQLNPEQEQRVFEIELNRRDRARRLQDSLAKNGKDLSKGLQDLSRQSTIQIEGVLDSLQKSKYTRYRMALARKKARKLKMLLKRR